MKQNEFEQAQDSKLLHERYQAESTEVPAPSLDKSILLAAHQAVDKVVNQQEHAGNKVLVKGGVKRSWYVSAAYAAVLVLSFSVFMTLSFDGEDRLFVPVGVELMESDSAARSMMDAQLSMKREMRAESLREERVRQSQQKHSMRRIPDKQRVSRVGAFDEGSAQSQLVRVSAQQQNHIDKLMQLFNAGELEPLKVALFEYRKEYPVSVLGEDLPEALRELEVKWNLDVEAAE